MSFKILYCVLNLIITGIPSIPLQAQVQAQSVARVLNLIITGIPSILRIRSIRCSWIIKVLNLIITGIPSIPILAISSSQLAKVLNLIITGIPSIPWTFGFSLGRFTSFKPYYNWNTFNTKVVFCIIFPSLFVLNLIITGIPSIQMIFGNIFQKQNMF